MYAHNKKVKVKEGDEVKKGEVISLMGDTGLTTGVHLHYSIYYKGEEVDPMEYVDLPYTDEVVKEYEDRKLVTK